MRRYHNIRVVRHDHRELNLVGLTMRKICKVKIQTRTKEEKKSSTTWMINYPPRDTSIFFFCSFNTVITKCSCILVGQLACMKHAFFYEYCCNVCAPLFFNLDFKNSNIFFSFSAHIFYKNFSYIVFKEYLINTC